MCRYVLLEKRATVCLAEIPRIFGALFDILNIRPTVYRPVNKTVE
jgi:hypothetical protein